ncbi:E3 ubiquitin-protein ligase RFWD2 [Papilio machaon]|uniref:E3 ubiquitin-protein ligase RFWD2 n=1 Tax=Papilio machaon TaxID=76193 RepID=A0A194QU24_PAPMA|nr:E3 ubiquitin-protein ligase RFWD2 [Papilio machaon]
MAFATWIKQHSRVGSAMAAIMSGTAATVGGAGAGPGGGGAALGGLGGSLEDKDCELLCPVCFELISEAYVTRCGHSFCYACIAKSVELQRRCPKCGAALASREHIFPNFLLNELVARRKLRARPAPPAGEAAEGVRLRALVAAEARHLGLAEVDGMLDVLTRRKRLLQAESAAAQHRLLYEFLSQLLRLRHHQLDQLAREATLVRSDLEQVGRVLRELRAGAPEPPRPLSPHALDHASEQQDCAEERRGEEEESFAGGPGGGAGGDAVAARWRRLTTHFDDFVQCYFAHRADELYFPGSSSATPTPGLGSAPGASRAPEGGEAGAGVGGGAGSGLGGAGAGAVEPCGGLEAFRADLAAFTRYRALRPLATLSYCSDAINYSTIVSTIEFDKDNEFFAIAGVTKRIKVFEFESVVRDAVDVHYPCAEMQCAHKVSCVSWNAYHKHVLASADYEGTVSVWDAAAGTRTRALQEHDKRCWSVHFNRADVRLLASGSDDARVKLWALNTERSVATLEAKFNVCCVRFNPASACHLAFGSADHCVHYYDLRAPRAPLAVFRDHRKAVSYVKFLDARTLLSASTDSQLKLWRVESPRCVRSFTGHANEKNFVGLATDGRYLACGSENNALYVYYSGLSRPLLVYKFEALRGFLERERRDEEPSEFVSAVCWRSAPDRPALLAANSQGTIKVLELV